MLEFHGYSSNDTVLCLKSKAALPRSDAVIDSMALKTAVYYIVVIHAYMTKNLHPSI